MKIDILIRCPLFRELSPNASRKMHWGTKARARTAATVATEIALLQMNAKPIPTPVHYHVTVGLMKGQKHGDDDNAKSNGTLKKVRDTLANTLTGGNDKDWHMDGLTQVRDISGDGYLLFTLEVPDESAAD